ncbi:thermonuclease family protein [Rhizobium sp. CSW-27]|uniref:thermonuclease family protein n=1 Tax=Rhizobium sp. CSW-27 TaxID=2839985 RepID=UPI001C013E1E|nr:thermonuclease family protein [Rhizobium sp. CSW-27]MBT9373099.1 thermonuclease family protein [Rhizobium sp. CSW-27]
MPKRRPAMPRKDLARDLAMTAAFLGLLALAAARWGDEAADAAFHGPFLAVDGDTLADAGQRLRLAGIDAPEIGQSCERPDGGAWPCGRAARARLSALLAEAAPECRGLAVDRYGRPLVTCVIRGDSLNARLVREGLALATGSPSYHAQQAAAKAERRGLWGGRFEMPHEVRRRAGQTEDEAAGRLWQWLTERIAWIWR